MLTLASNGKAEYTIVLPAKQTEQEYWAAFDLKNWLDKMTGAQFPKISEGTGDVPTGKVISVGSTQMLENANLAESKIDLADEGYAIAVKGETLFLFGGRKRGPIYAVYALLEEDLGCRWYDRKSEPMIPSRPELKFRPVPRHSVPILEARSPHSWEAFSWKWAVANRTSGWMSSPDPIGDKLGGYMRAPFVKGVHYDVHTSQYFLPAKEFFDTHPEYFSELEGVRKPVQLCLTSPDVLDIVTCKVKEVLGQDPGASLISVSPNDGGGYCECKKCKVINDAEETKMGTLLDFVNNIATSIEADFPNVRVSTLAYLDTAMPPKTISPRKNVVIQLCTDWHAWWWPFCFVTETQKFQEAMKAWHRVGATIYVWDYTVNFSHYPLPMPNMPVVTPNLHFFLENGATGVMFQGDGWGPGSENATMRSWVWAKQLWNPSLDTQTLMRDFIYGYYGEAAGPMWKYNRMLWKLWEYWHKKPHTPHTLECENPLLVTSNRFPPTSALFCKQYLDQSTALFAEAQRLAEGNPATERRVALAKFPLLYVKLCQGIGYYICNMREFSPGPVTKAPTPELIAEYTALLDEFEAIAGKECITHLAEGREGDVPAKIKKWREMLVM
jgi:hypothetical protein